MYQEIETRDVLDSPKVPYTALTLFTDYHCSARKKACILPLLKRVRYVVLLINLHHHLATEHIRTYVRMHVYVILHQHLIG
jgi:hypothetical protein